MTTRESDKFMLRMPDGLRGRIKSVADRNNRSMNSEIVSTLEQAYPEAKDTMHLHIEDIRRILDLYEHETDPRRRMFFQLTVEGLASGSTSVDWDEFEK